MMKSRVKCKDREVPSKSHVKDYQVQSQVQVLNFIVQVIVHSCPTE